MYDLTTWPGAPCARVRPTFATALLAETIATKTLASSSAMGVIVTAARTVNMPLGLRLIVGMVVIVIVIVGPVMPMPMVACVRVAMAGRPGPVPFGLEGLAGFGHHQVQRLQQRHARRIGLDHQPLWRHLHGHAPPAQMEGGSRQIRRAAVLRAGANIQHRLRRRLHAHQ